DRGFPVCSIAGSCWFRARDDVVGPQDAGVNLKPVALTVVFDSIEIVKPIPINRGRFSAADCHGQCRGKTPREALVYRTRRPRITSTIPWFSRSARTLNRHESSVRDARLGTMDGRGNE